MVQNINAQKNCFKNLPKTQFHQSKVSSTQRGHQESEKVKILVCFFNTHISSNNKLKLQQENDLDHNAAPFILMLQVSL